MSIHYSKKSLEKVLMDDDQIFMDERQAAKFLQMAPMSLYKMRKDTETKLPLPYIRIGKVVRYDRTRLVEWLRAHEVTCNTDKRNKRPTGRGPGRPRKVKVAAESPVVVSQEQVEQVAAQ